MTEKQRAEQAQRALALLSDALELLENAAYDGPEELDDTLWWAYNRFNHEYYNAVEVDLYDPNGNLIPAPLDQLVAAIKERL
jgi:hypothetical protein